MSCGICLDPLHEDTAILPCQHILHISCAANYFLFQRFARVWIVRCPYCRCRISDEFRFEVFHAYVTRLRKERKIATHQLRFLKTKLRTHKIKLFMSKLLPAHLNSPSSGNDGNKDILEIKIKHLGEQIGEQTRLIFKIQWCMWSS